MGSLLTAATSDLDAGVQVQAVRSGNKLSIVAVNLKARKDRTTDLTITLPSSVAGLTPTYYLIDSGHSDYYDASPDDGTLQTVTAPAIVAGTITLTLQPRSVHLLQFRGATPETGHAVARFYGGGTRTGGTLAPFALPRGALTNASVTINGVDLSDHVTSLQFTVSLEILDITLVGDRAHRYAPGVRTIQTTVSFLQDYGLLKVDAVLFPLLGSSGFTIAVKPNHAQAASPVNPEYTATYILTDYKPLAGTTGAAATADVTFTAVTDVTAVTS